MNKTEYVDWKSNPVTEEVFEELSQRVEGLKAELAGSAGLDPLFDRFRAGAIQAFTDVLNTSYEEAEND